MGTDQWTLNLKTQAQKDTKCLERYGTCKPLHGDSNINTMGYENSTGFGVSKEWQMEIVSGPYSPSRTDKCQPQPIGLSFHLCCFMLLKGLHKI